MTYMIPVGQGVETTRQRRDELNRLRDEGNYGLRIDEPRLFRDEELRGSFHGVKVYGRTGLEGVLEVRYCRAILLVAGDDGSLERIDFSYQLNV